MAKKNVTYAECLKKLEDIITTLENNDIALEESIKLYNEGMQTVFLCEQKLSDVEKQIVLLKATGDELEEEAV